jgi:hypothetical protein
MNDNYAMIQLGARWEVTHRSNRSFVTYSNGDRRQSDCFFGKYSGSYERSDHLLKKALQPNIPHIPVRGAGVLEVLQTFERNLWAQGYRLSIALKIMDVTVEITIY